ncbi:MULTISPECIES: flagellin [Sphingomonadaceae]|uniref:flagellin n=1 Tax=Sphingomonadaceae TaxID=41297 RepID=UPI001157BD68|nr:MULTISPECIES: flagellin [Sphingomonadaceae]QDK33771.1 flagellin [Sphingomonas sp. IC081]QSR17528.1 flagellin [Novosphingobium sp. KA1]
MAFSVNTNAGAMAALQSLNATNRSMETTQSRINTGLNVASTKDDSAKYTVAQTLRGDQGGLTAVTSSLNNAKSVVDVAVSGAEQISDLINDMKSKAYEAASATDSGTLEALQKDYDGLKSQIDSIISSSDFNGVNLLDSSGGSVSSLQTLDTGNLLTVSSVNIGGLSGGSATLSGLSGSSDLASATAAASTVDNLDALSDALNTQLSTLGAKSRQIDGQLEFTSNLSDVIETGIGNLVDADLAKESAKLQALQVQQQLGVQALSIANQAPQTILSLFR